MKSNDASRSPAKIATDIGSRAIYNDANSDRKLPAGQRPVRDTFGRPQRSSGSGEYLVSRGLRERAAGTNRVRALVRAHALPGIRSRRLERTLRAHSARRRNAERLHLARAHQLLRDRPVKPAGACAVAGGGPDGRASSGDDAGEARQPAGRREKRKTMERGQSALRDDPGKTAGDLIPA